MTCATQPYVTQGPDWLARLYLCPPPWLNPALAALAAAVAIVVLYRLRERGWTVEPDTQREMLVIAWTVVGVLLATLAMARWAGQPYLVDVGVGLVVGWGGVQAVQAALARVGPDGWPAGLAEPRERLLAAWAALAVLTMAGSVLEVPGMLPALRYGRLYLMALGAAMGVYNAAELAEGTSTTPP